MRVSPQHFFPTVSLVLAVFSAGCAVWGPSPFSKIKTPPALPESYLHYYDYPKIPLTNQVILEQKTPSFVMRRIEIPLSLPTDLEIKDKDAFQKEVKKLAETDAKKAEDLKLRYVIRIDYYLPRNLKPGEKRPAILISPILGGNMVVDRFARYYAGRGMIAALVYRKRVFWDDKEGIEQVENYLRASVIRIRQAVDWLEKQPEADPERIGAFGISYGAVLHSVAAAVEPRVKYHVLAMPGGPLPEIIIHCPDKAIKKLVRGARKKYGWPKKKIYEDLKRTLRTDPIYLAPYVPRNKVELYAALFDRVVGARRTFRLWKAMGKPKLRILPFGHYGGILVFPYLQTQSYRAFKHHLRK